jgi:hypothetical protein
MFVSPGRTAAAVGIPSQQHLLPVFVACTGGWMQRGPHLQQNLLPEEAHMLISHAGGLCAAADGRSYSLAVSGLRLQFRLQFRLQNVSGRST